MQQTYRHHIQYTARKITRLLNDFAPHIYRQHLPLTVEIAPDGIDPAAYEGWQPLRPGEWWGANDEWRYLHAEATIPVEWAGLRVALFAMIGNTMWNIHTEALLSVNGEVRQGFDPFHREALLTESATGGEQYSFLLRAWTTSFLAANPAPVAQVFQTMELVEVIPEARRLFHSFETALGTAQAIDPDSLEHHQLLNALEAGYQALYTASFGSPEFYASIAGAQAALDAELAKGRSIPARVAATGHAHIDVAWLWRLKNTREKAQHSFGNVLRLMEQYPDFHFTQSQAQLYDYIQQDAPHILAQIQQRVKEGRWEPTGGAWVEPDCNIPSGESLVRQILYGRTLLRNLFGTDSPILWLPDTFGYSWALPQLIMRSGLKYFMTSKISWNQYNRLPYDSFRWRGIDGTEVVTHFLTAYHEHSATYNGEVTPDEVSQTWSRYQQKEVSQEVLTSFGWGDGGGGPTPEMLERLDRMKDHPGLPQVEQGSAAGFFERLASKAEALPVWNGELYFELHRGTYTTQARNKRANRQAELLYHRAEFAAAAAFILMKQPYPKALLDEGWKLILLNQFHDIIPGSSIPAVYVDSALDYVRIMQIGQQVLHDALSALSERWSEEPNLWLVSSGPVQGIRRAGTPPAQAAVILNASERQIETDYLRVQFNALGEITSLFDKTVEREIIPPGALANVLQAFEDRPMDWEAWDIDIYFEDKHTTATPVSIQLVESTPGAATLEVHKRIGASAIVQRITVRADSRRITFHTHIDWQERHTLLKVAFPVDLLAPAATFDIQFGNVERPTHRNTSWDWARFESVGHKWAQLAERDYAVALLNDCKYGYDVHDNVLRLSLLRSPTWPDPKADQGAHEFTYSLFLNPGATLWRTVQEGYAMHDPAYPFVPERAGSPHADLFTLFQVDGTGVILETVKGAEDGRGIIVRLYEAVRHRGNTALRCGFRVAQVIETNLIEEDEREIPIDHATTGDAIPLYFTPYQIRTLRIIPAGE